MFNVEVDIQLQLSSKPFTQTHLALGEPILMQQRVGGPLTTVLTLTMLLIYYERVLCETAAWLSGSKLVDGGITAGHNVIDDAVLTKRGRLRHVAEPSTVKLNSIVAGSGASVR